MMTNEENTKLAYELKDAKCNLAILWNALRKLLDDTQHNDHDCGDGDCPVLVAKEALTTTQQSSDAFIAEVKARALEDAAKWFDENKIPLESQAAAAIIRSMIHGQ